MRVISRARQGRTRRSGVHTVEMIIALPVLFIASLAVFQFGILFIFQQGVTAATIEGAREASEGGSLATVQTVVNNFLQPYGINIQAGSTDANIRLEIDTTTDTTLNATPCFATGPKPLLSNEVRVTVAVSLVPTGGSSAWGTHDGVPNWLSRFGFSMSSQRFEVSSLAKKE